jgi:AcrR family transcriptional regulator
MPSRQPPKRYHHGDLRRVLIDEAVSLVAAQGPGAVSLRELAARAGVTHAAPYRHFASKDVLYATVLGQLIDGVQRAVTTAATSEGSFEERLDALSDALTTTLGAQPYAARLLVREVMDWGPVVRQGLGRTIQDVLVGSLEFAKAGQREGVFNAQLDATQAIVSIIGVHFMPFAIGDLIEKFTGTSPFQISFVEDRKAAVRQHVRSMILARA